MTQKNSKKEKTLNIQWPFGFTIGLSLIFLIIILVSAEIVVRFQPVKSLLPIPSIASGQKRLDVKLAYLNNLVEKDIYVNCIFLGGSIVNAAIEPEVFKRFYKRYTKKDIICFNFGIDRLIPPAAAVMAEILVDKYKPSLLIWGMSPASFSEKVATKVKKLMMKNPWCSYRLGNFSFEGWLSDHSYAYRYFLRFRIWLEQPEHSKKLWQCEYNTLTYGNLRRTEKKNPKIFKVNPNRIAIFRSRLVSFEMSKDSIDALNRIMQLKSKTVIVIVEIPIHRSLLSLYDNGPRDHYKTTSYIAKQAENHGILFIPTAHLDIIPDKGWRNRNHMNGMGARIFSQWLGEQIGLAVKNGAIKESH